MLSRQEIDERIKGVLGNDPDKFYANQVVQYGNHKVTLVIHKDFKLESLMGFIEGQLRTAEQRDITPDQDSILLVASIYQEEGDYSGAFVNVNKALAEFGFVNDPQFNVLQLNTAVMDDTAHQYKVAEHELWHAIDYMGNHSDIRNDRCRQVDYHKIDADTQQMVNDNFKESFSHGAFKRMIDVRLDQFRQYANHGSEWFVHQQMCETWGLTPGSFEGYMITHDLHKPVLTVFDGLLDSDVPRSVCRKIWQKYFWGNVIQTRPYWRNNLEEQGYKWLLR